VGGAGGGPGGTRGTGPCLPELSEWPGNTSLDLPRCSQVEEASHPPRCAALFLFFTPRSARGTGDALQPLRLWTGQGFPTSPVRARGPCLLAGASVVPITGSGKTPSDASHRLPSFKSDNPRHAGNPIKSVIPAFPTIRLRQMSAVLAPFSTKPRPFPPVI